jgi:predicted AlkP superfamily pyrophosphatase or phosphodiesterase
MLHFTSYPNGVTRVEYRELVADIIPVSDGFMWYIAEKESDFSVTKGYSVTLPEAKALIIAKMTKFYTLYDKLTR